MEKPFQTMVKTNPKQIKKVVLLYPELRGFAGAERLMYEEAIYLGRCGIETAILTFHLEKKALAGYERLVNIEVIPRDNILRRVLALRKRLKQLKPDLAIAQHYGASAYLYLATMFLRIPYVSHEHGTIFWFPRDVLKYALIHRGVFHEIRQSKSVEGHREFIPARPPRRNPIRRLWGEMAALVVYRAMRKSRQVFVLSDHMAWEVNKLYKRDAVAVRGGLDPELFDYTPRQDIKAKLGLDGKSMILNVNRLYPDKRVDLLIKAFEAVHRELGDAVLVIGGRGPEEMKLKALAQELGLEKQVMFMGFIEEKELWGFYAACDVFVHPNWAEFAIAPLEALALGKKVVWSTEMESFGPISAGSQVFAARPTVNDFALAIKSALASNVEGRLDLSDYTWDSYFDRIYALCEQALATG